MIPVDAAAPNIRRVVRRCRHPGGASLPACRGAGSYAYRIYAAVGTLSQVETVVDAMRNDAELGPSHVQPLG